MNHISCKLIPVALLTYSTACQSPLVNNFSTQQQITTSIISSLLHISHIQCPSLLQLYQKLIKKYFFHARIPMKCIHGFTFFLKNFCCNYHQQIGNSLPVSNLDSNLQNNKCNMYRSHKF